MSDYTLEGKSPSDIVKLLRKCDSEYYGSGNSVISDHLYDLFKDQLRKLDPTNNYLNEVGAEPIEDTHWEKHKHEYPLGSLSKVNTIEDLVSWASAEVFSIQPKLDGISISLTYENGILQRAVTRGKKGIGDDITRNVLKMKGIKKNIDVKTKVVIRGEIVMTYTDFESLPLDKKGKNPRNTTTGAAKKLNGELCKYLTIIVYDLMNASELGVITESMTNRYLCDLGFEHIVESHKVSGKESLVEKVKELESSRGSYNYDIDGLVIKNNNIDFKDNWELPKNKISYKFEHQRKETKLVDIVWQTSGERINPIAILEPVDICGITITKVSLHNSDYINTLTNGNILKSGSVVEVSRRNEVIPQVEQVLQFSTEGRDLQLEPKSCPCCGSNVELAKNDDGKNMAWYICPNDVCPAKALKKVLKWFNVHDSKGVAEKTIELLYDNFNFSDFADFVKIVTDCEHKHTILSINGMGESKLKNIIDEINKTKNTTISNFLGGLNIGGFGPKRFQKIVDYLLDKNESVNLDVVCDFIFNNDISEIEGFNTLTSLTLQKKLKDNLTVIHELKNIGFSCSPEEKTELIDSTLSGKSFCFTGALSLPRKEAQNLVESKGGVVKSSVAKGLDYLVTNDPHSGSSKNKKANSLGVKIIDEQQFLDLTK